MTRFPPAAARMAPRKAAAPAVALVLLLAAGCSGGKAAKPGDSLADAETAVARAERARIGDYDPASWKAARANLAEARSAADGTDKDAATVSRWYAARARADAELGVTRAERSRLAALTQALRREITSLQPARPAAVDAAPAVTP